MTKKPHKTRPGEFEIRILPDGRIVAVGPNAEVLAIVERVVEGLGEEEEQRAEEKLKTVN